MKNNKSIDKIKSHILITCGMNDNDYVLRQLLKKGIDFEINHLLDITIKNNSSKVLEFLIEKDPQIKKDITKSCLIYKNSKILNSLSEEIINLNLEESIIYSIKSNNLHLFDRIKFDIFKENEIIIHEINKSQNKDLFLKIKSDNPLDNSVLLQDDYQFSYRNSEEYKKNRDYINFVADYCDINDLSNSNEIIRNLIKIQYNKIEDIILNYGVEKFLKILNLQFLITLLLIITMKNLMLFYHSQKLKKLLKKKLIKVMMMIFLLMLLL